MFCPTPETVRATKIHGGVWKVLKVVAETSQTVTLKEHDIG